MNQATSLRLTLRFAKLPSFPGLPGFQQFVKRDTFQKLFQLPIAFLRRLILQLFRHTIEGPVQVGRRKVNPAAVGIGPSIRRGPSVKTPRR